jgi:NAD-dependent deacetylase
MKKKIFVLTGAGISKESGVPTFRDSKDGLWYNYKIEDVASLEGWEKDPETVLNFYNDRRDAVKACEPNEGHKYLAKLEENFEVNIFTQNIDDLHERAGSTNVWHVHGSLTEAVSEKRDEMSDGGAIDIGYNHIKLGDLASDGGQLRPNVVFFGEFVHYELEAQKLCHEADYVIVVGSSLVVYPVAQFLMYRREDAPLYIIDPNEIDFKERFGPWAIYIKKTGSEGMKEMYDKLTGTL